MYESFYGLTEKPFTLLPDPEYLYLSPKHQRADIAAIRHDEPGRLQCDLW